jgi:uncharacterized membrane protein
MSVKAASEKDLNLHSATSLIYVLQGVGYFSVVPLIFVAVVINYVQLADTKDTVYESHFRWQIRTFWFSLLWFALGILTFPIMIGIGIFIANWVWVIYRVIKGWTYMTERKALYDDVSLEKIKT